LKTYIKNKTEPVMRNLKNMVRLIGNVGMDPELRTLTNGNTVARFSLATSEGYINKEGEKVIDTQWHRIVAWGKTAQLVEKICRKGNRIAVDGKLTNRSYEDDQGEKKYITEIIANELMVINSQVNKSTS
jgi:single-strand DNA-binding protein